MAMNTPAQEAVDRARLSYFDKLESSEIPGPARQCLWVILQRSFALGRTRCWIPNFRYFQDSKGITQISEISRAIDWLAQKFVIQAPLKRKGRRQPGWYGINVLFGNWAVAAKKMSGRAEQMWMSLEEPDLPEALRLNFVEFGPSGPTMPHGSGVSLADRPGPPGPERVGHAYRMPAGDAVAAGQPGLARHVPGATPARTVLPSPGGVPSEVLTVAVGLSPAAVGKNPTVSGVSPGTVGKSADFVGDPTVLTVGKNPTAEIPFATSAAVGGVPAESPIALAENFPTVLLGKTQQLGGVSPHTPLPGELQGLQKTLNELQRAQCSFVIPRARAHARAERLTWAEYRFIRERLTAWVGAEDMQRSGTGARSLWEKAIRLYPNEVLASLERMGGLERRGHFVDQQHRISVLVMDLTRACGVRKWAALPVGPEPV